MTTEAHIHRWILAPDLVQNVPGACACGETRTFPGGVPLTTEAPYSFRAREHSPQMTMASRKRGGEAFAKKKALERAAE